MRYEVIRDNRNFWQIWDNHQEFAVLMAHNSFPDAEFMARTQCAFLNESPAMQSS